MDQVYLRKLYEDTSIINKFVVAGTFKPTIIRIIINRDN